MKRSLGSSDSLSAFMSICPSTADKKMMSPRPSNTSFLYTGVQEFPSILDGDGGIDDDGCLEEINGGQATTAAEKKRRLSVEQVKALEKNFEIENKLEPERKVKLAQELGLQPRQVAVWFQNRRARWKTKQLERDYGALKANYDSLLLSRDALQRDNDALLREIKELRAKLNIEETGTSHSVSIKEEEDVIKAAAAPPPPAMAHDGAIVLSHIPPPPLPLEASSELEYETFNIFPPADSFKDGPADSSDSSAVLNDQDYSPTAAAAAAEMTIGCFGQFVKMEEHGDLFSGEEACKLFADDEQWYCSDQWDS